MTFNLCYDVNPTLQKPSAPVPSNAMGQLEAELAAWCQRAEEGQPNPSHLIHVLDHSYSQIALSFVRRSVTFLLADLISGWF